MNVTAASSYSTRESQKEVKTALKNTNIANRAKYGFNSARNIQKCQLAGTAATAAGAGATYVAANYVAKTPAAQTALKNFGTFVKNSNFAKELGKLAKEATPYVQKAATWAKNLPGPAKAVLIAGIIVTIGVLNKISNQYTYNQGKIDQNLIDKSNVKM